MSRSFGQSEKNSVLTDYKNNLFSYLDPLSLASDLLDLQPGQLVVRVAEQRLDVHLSLLGQDLPPGADDGLPRELWCAVLGVGDLEDPDSHLAALSVSRPQPAADHDGEVLVNCNREVLSIQ